MCFCKKYPYPVRSGYGYALGTPGYVPNKIFFLEKKLGTARVRLGYKFKLNYVVLPLFSFFLFFWKDKEVRLLFSFFTISFFFFLFYIPCWS